MRDVRRRIQSGIGNAETRQRSSQARLPVSPVLSLAPISQRTMTKSSRRKYVWYGTALLLGGVVWGMWFLKQAIMTWGETGVAEVTMALADARQGNFETSRMHLMRAEEQFAYGASWLRPLAWLPDALGQLPGFAHGMTGEALFRSGREGARAALSVFPVLPSMLALQTSGHDTASIIDLLKQSGSAATEARTHLDAAERAFRRVQPETLPVAYRDTAQRVRDVLPIASALLGGYAEHQSLFADLLGANGPRTYLFLFQNNHELRATGGFIGSYALLDIRQGKVRRFFVDGIFNPDGQLKENIIPPKPIQKISAGWSLHDSNWFPDFPTSAEKAMFFYEKTGGPTVDGIVTLTPEVLGRILALVGPVALPEYGVTIDTENFMPIIQEEVEENYDREENNPKKILGDLVEILLARFLSFDHPNTTWEFGTALATLLSEKHILLYSRHPEIQALIRGAGWSGEVLETPRDYLSVIHTNINGFKTDGVVREAIAHEAVIQADGTVRDTVTITRQHTGGKTGYVWWDKVNADYVRVYVPKGSVLLVAEGMTREFPEAPLDYDALGFRRDPDIVREEEGMVIDEATGTRISTDAGKTVFGNWVYVSPGESVTLRYVYDLPFVVAFDSAADPPVTSYSVLYQKQSGTDGVSLHATIRYPECLRPVWQTPGNLIPYQRVFETQRSLSTDYYWGVVFGSGCNAP